MTKTEEQTMRKVEGRAMRSAGPVASIFAIVLACVLPANASRPKSYSLSDCIREADTIMTGVVLSCADDGELGVLKVRVLRMFKGKLDEKEIAICGQRLHSTRNGSYKDGPIKVEPKKGYIFFLKAKPDENGRYSMFDPCDGIVQPNGPVNREIRNQLREADAAK
jgi:hypothetical protein